MAKKKKKRKVTTHKKTRKKVTKPSEPNALDELELLLTEDIEPNHRDQVSKKDDSRKEETILADIITIKKRQRFLRWIIGGLAGVLAVVIATISGFYYFGGVNPVANNSITIKINGPEKVVTGEEVSYTITYKNDGDVDIKNAKLIFKEPTGFKISETDPLVSGRSWDLEDLTAGEKGSVTITGKIIDNPESTQKFTATLIFVPINFNSEFTIEDELNIALLPPTVTIATTMQKSVTLGETIPLKLAITNDNLNTIDQMKLRLSTPEGFTILNSSPTESAQDEWQLLEFQPAETKEITIEGAFSTDLTFENNDAREKEFSLEVLLPDDEGQFFPQVTKTFTTKIVDQALVAYMIIDGSAESKNVNLEDTLNFSLVYENKGEEDYTNVSISAIIKTSPDQILDWKNLSDEEFGALEKTDNGRKLTWSATQIPTLEVLKPGDEGTIDFTLPIKAFKDLENVSVEDLGKNIIEAYTLIELTDESGNPLPPIESSHLILNLNSNVALTSEARYYLDDGTAVGTGPLPPEPGEETTYQIVWQITNDLHELNDISVSATLPEQVTWTNKTELSAGEIKFNAKTNTVTWNLNRLPLSADNATAFFELRLKPRTDDLGKLMKLLNNSILKVTDAVTEDIITITQGIITTNLEFDDYGSGKGVVSEPHPL